MKPTIRITREVRSLLLFLVWLHSGLLTGVGAVPRVLPPGQLPDDVRLQPLKDLDGYFPFSPSATPEAWAQRAEATRRQILVSMGLWPLPTRTPLNPVVHGRLDRGDYTVEKVYFESMPGFFVTGNLYRPKDRPGRLPGVLCPHGHWANGRFLETSEAETKRELEAGAERFEEGGRSVLQARCVQLARMGCVVFHYDMLGYADSVQIPMELAHGFAKQRPEMNDPERWGLFSPQAESHGQSVMGLQTWNSIRALDFLAALEDVDPGRIGVTGASGGGTQTFILGAVDSRPAVAFPAVMVSTAMQGGCTCENACGLRVDTGNVEFAALFAPRPLGLTAANDWTKEMPTKGFPELQRHYAMLGVPDRVALTALLQFGHNYNHPSRVAMYSWLNRHLRLGCPEPVEERDFRRLSREEMSVWDAAHARPGGGPEFERRLLQWWAEDAQRQISAAAAQPGDFKKLAGPAVATLVGRGLPDAGGLAWIKTSETAGSSGKVVAGLLRNRSRGEELPLVILRPARPNGRVVLWLSDAGKAGLWETPQTEAEPRVRASVAKLLGSGTTVVGVDLLFQGEFLADGQPLTQTRRVKNPREAAAYTFGYNPTVFAQRVHDVLTVLGWLRSRPAEVAPSKVGQKWVLGVAAVYGAGPWVAAARAVVPSVLDRAVIDTGGFRFGKVTDLQSPDFLPGGAKYLDLPGMLALGAPSPILLAGEGGRSGDLACVITKAHAGSRGVLEVTAATGADLERRAVRWLLK